MDDVNGVTPAGSCMRDHPVMLSAAKPLDARGDRPFAAAQGDIVKCLRLMLIGRNELGPIGINLRKGKGGKQDS
jgi:hypothetical protein